MPNAGNTHGHTNTHARKPYTHAQSPHTHLVAHGRAPCAHLRSLHTPQVCKTDTRLVYPDKVAVQWPTTIASRRHPLLNRRRLSHSRSPPPPQLNSTTRSASTKPFRQEGRGPIQMVWWRLGPLQGRYSCRCVGGSEGYSPISRCIARYSYYVAIQSYEIAII